jgi:hypothetical protein
MARLESRSAWALLLVGALAWALAACDEDADATASAVTSGPGPGSGGGGAGGMGGTPDPGPPASPKALVRFKGAERLRNELASALGLEPTAVCRELGKYDCFAVHAIVLGDPDAFGSGIYEPLATTTATSPLAAERVALSGCVGRVDADLGGPGPALVYQGLPIVGGKLADTNAPEIDGAVDRLYRRALGRRAKDHELAQHRALYADVEASGKSATPARDWAVGSCFATLTSLEFMFY